jgi:hypothetical protein
MRRSERYAVSRGPSLWQLRVNAGTLGGLLALPDGRPTMDTEPLDVESLQRRLGSGWSPRFLLF